MTNVEIKLNSEGVQELLKSDEMQVLLSELASSKVGQAGGGYEYSVKVGQRRAYANIYPASKEAYQDNLDNNTLEKVIRS